MKFARFPFTINIPLRFTTACANLPKMKMKKGPLIQALLEMVIDCDLLEPLSELKNQKEMHYLLMDEHKGLRDGLPRIEALALALDDRLLDTLRAEEPPSAAMLNVIRARLKDCGVKVTNSKDREKMSGIIAGMAKRGLQLTDPLDDGGDDVIDEPIHEFEAPLAAG